MLDIEAKSTIHYDNIIVVKLLFFILILLKGIDRLVFASIWAEDGKIFLKQAFEIGWESLFISYDGYFHTIPRLIALTATWFPVALIPFYIVAVCYTITAYSITLILDRPYDWLFQDKKFRVVCALLLLLLPGQIVILGNTANIHWYLLLILAIFGLKDIREPYNLIELLIISLCVSSEGSAILLMPLFITRIILKNSYKNYKFFGEIFIIILIILFAYFHILLASKGPISFNLFDYKKLYIDHFLYFFILHIFIGDSLVQHISLYENILKIFSFLILIGAIYAIKKNWEREFLLIIVLVFCALFLPIMIAFARPQNLEILRTFFEYDVYEWFRFRYSFFIPAISSIFWTSLISRISKPKWFPPSFVAMVLIVNVFLNSYRIPIQRYLEYKDWYAKSSLLQKSMREGCPQTVFIKINPKDWTVLFKSPIKNDCD